MLTILCETIPGPFELLFEAAYQLVLKTGCAVKFDGNEGEKWIVGAGLAWNVSGKNNRMFCRREPSIAFGAKPQWVEKP